MAVLATDWPHGSGKFTIYPESGKRRAEGNGVVPIKIPCLRKLRELDWQVEQLPVIPNSVFTTGDLDALYLSKSGYFGFEWETGNIASGHRAMNKLLLTLKMGGLVGGFLVVPSDRLKGFLTDRISIIGELRHYFPLWQDTRLTQGVLQIVVVEQDAESLDVPRIPKGRDGRALG
jgi:Restriction endonuclease BamHI